MNRVRKNVPATTEGTALGLYRPPVAGMNVAHWKINGFPASIIVWTAEEWAQLSDRPTDAQFYACGVWCALRLA